MNVINLTPHSIDVYNEGDFVDLEQTTPTTWVADGVEGSPVASYPSQGEARIATEVKAIEVPGLPGVIVKTTYGEATGIPPEAWDSIPTTLVVSLPMQSKMIAAGHPLANIMAAPYKVVRLRSNGSHVLGCMGFTFQ